MHPLSLRVSLARNPLQTLPMLVATLLAALGIASVVMLATSIARTALAPNDFLLGALLVQPRGITLAQADARVREVPETGDTFRVRSVTVRGRFLDIEMPFPIHFVAGGRSGEFLQRYGDHISEGRLPAPATLEVAIPVSLARSRQLKVGDPIRSLDVPLSFRIVGLVDGPRWVGVASLPEPTPVEADSLIVFPRGGTDTDTLETRLRQRLGASVSIRHWTVDPGGSETEDRYVADLALVLGFIVVINAAVLAAINGLLALLYFRQRRREFVLLSVLGWSRRALARRALAEMAVVIGAGWVLGIVATWMFMRLVDAVLFVDRGIAVAFYDPTPALLTFPLVLTSVAISAVVVGAGLLRFDPMPHLQAQ